MNSKIRILILVVILSVIFAISGGVLANFVPGASQPSHELILPQGKEVFQGTGHIGGAQIIQDQVELAEWKNSQGGGTIVTTNPLHESLGGCATVKVIEMVSGGTLNAILVNAPPASANGANLSCAAQFEFSAAGTANVCFALPPGKEGKIVFWDMSKNPPVETVLDTTVANGIACAVASQNGIYVLVGK